MEQIEFVCISLRKDEERRRRISRLFTQMDLDPSIINWWIVEKHPVSGIYGCFESHWFVWHHRWSKPYLCVFEDDALLAHPEAGSLLRKLVLVLPSIFSPPRGTSEEEEGFDFLSLCFDPLGYQSEPFLQNKDFSLHEGKFIGLLAYIIQPSKFCSRIGYSLLNDYGYEVDICLSEKIRQVSIYPSLVYQTYGQSNVSPIRKNLWYHIITKPFLNLKNRTLGPDNYFWYRFVLKSVRRFKSQGWKEVEFKNRRLT